MFNFTSLPPLTLYVHLPWCIRKCPYCDFNSHEASSPFDELVYINALISDLEQDLPRAWGRTVESIFIGGGTPSLFTPEAIDRMLSEIRARLPLAPNLEITLEANPGTMEKAKFHGFRTAGINRLSLGIQSFNNSMLKKLGRIHNAEEAARAVTVAHDAGFDNINLDLMYGLPGQTIEDAAADLATAITLAPTHISHYQLTIEPNTVFHLQPPRLPDDDVTWDMQRQCQQQLAEHGYQQYEISAYAQASRECRHNLNYWSFGDYLAIGAGAHAKITDAQQQNITRLWKIKNPQSYMDHVSKGSHIGGENSVSRHDAGLEFMMNTLRLTEGFPVNRFLERTGLPITLVDAPLELAENKGLIERDLHTIRPTALGKRHLNELLTLFLNDD